MNTPHILYDSQIFDAQTLGGISRYFCEIIPRMNITYDIGLRFTDNVYLQSRHINRHQFYAPQWIFQKYKQKITRMNQKYSISLMKKRSNYLFHATYYDPYFLSHIGNHPFVITVHDMTYERLPEYFLPREVELIYQQKKTLIDRAQRIIAISQNTRKDLIEIMGADPNKIDVIYHGTDMKPLSSYPSMNLPEKYVLYVGSRYKYKNFYRFVRSFAQLAHKDSHLHLMCTGHPFHDTEFQLLETLNITSRTHCIQASDIELCTLYHQAQAFVFPSLYEGFGIPILEAYTCQCPVVLSHSSCFPEIAGDAGAYFDPTDTNDIASCLAEVLYHPARRKELVEKGNLRRQLYSWEQAAQQTAICYQKALKKPVDNDLNKPS